MNTVTQPIININNQSEFESEVVQADVPIIVDFWAEWCGPCRSIAPVLQEIADEKNGSVKIVKVNVDENPDLAQRFEIRSIPTMLFYKDGLVKDVAVGASPKQTIIDKLDAIS